MINQSELTELLTLQGDSDSPILSIYVNVDQTNMSNVNRGFEVTLRNLLNECERQQPEAARKAFRDDVRKIMDFLSGYTPQKKTLVLFCDASSGFFFERSIRVPVPSQCYWEQRPHLRPLVEALDEYERYGVILTDRAHARLFTIVFGEIEENSEALAEADVKRFDASGSDRMLSQSTFQRSADEHAKAHLKNVAGMIERLSEEQRFDRLLLAGPTEAVAKLHERLSSSLQKRVVGTLALPMIASEREILDATLARITEVERSDEADTVNKLITAAAKQQQAVVGLPHTVEAAVEGRIMSLVYTDDFDMNDGEWQAGQKKYHEIQALAPIKADAKVENAVDLLEWLVVHVARQGGRVEQVKDGAAELLKKDARGIGAFLRF